MGVHKGFFALFLLILVWLAGKFLLPFLFPFLLGAGIALASEPAVRLGTDRLKLSRGLAAGVGVTLTLIFLLGLVFFFGALLMRELGTMVKQLPQMARQSADLLEDSLVTLSAKAPEPVGPVLTDSIHRFFRDSDLLTDLAALPQGTTLDMLVHPNSDSVLSLRTAEKELLNFDEAMSGLSGERMGFLILGLIMYIGAAMGAYFLLTGRTF